ncbi:pyocin knob domain-containing protein [Morganella morganii]
MTKIFKIPFATQGDRTVVPDEVQADGSLSYTQGYGYDYERDQATDPAAKDIEREKMNGIFHDITGAVGEIQAFGMPVWAEEGKPYAIRSIVYHNKKAWQSKIENNNTEPAAGIAWTELKADLTAGDIDAYTRGEADKKFQPLGNYLPAGYSYSKAESDTNYQPKGNYAPTGNYAMKGDSYTKAESDNKYFDAHTNVLSVDLNSLGASSHAGIYYQPANAGATEAYHYPISEAGSLLITQSAYGCQQEYTAFSSGRKFVRGLTTSWNGKDGPWGAWSEYSRLGVSYTKVESDYKYQPAGNSYSKSESDGRYEKKGAAKGWRWVGGYGNASSSISMSEDVRGKQLYFQLTGSGGSNWTTVCMPPVDNIALYFFQGTAGWGVVCTQGSGRTLKSVGGQYIEWSSVYVAD